MTGIHGLLTWFERWQKFVVVQELFVVLYPVFQGFDYVDQTRVSDFVTSTMSARSADTYLNNGAVYIFIRSDIGNN